MSKNVCVILVFWFSTMLSTNVLPEGLLWLAADSTMTGNSATLEAFQIKNIILVYQSYWVPEHGPDGIHGLEFRLVNYTPDNIVILTDEIAWNPYTSITMGDVLTDMSIAFYMCVGEGKEKVVIGTIPVMALVDLLPYGNSAQIKVEPGTSTMGTLPIVAACDEIRSIYEVYGGYFYLPYDPDAVEYTTWGAI